MWRDFFGEKARIIGIDLNPDARRWEQHGFEIYIGSQSDPKFWEYFFSKVGNIDVLLDDGGHSYEEQIITAETVLPFINDGGLLVVEDTHTSYQAGWGPKKYSFVNYAKNKIDGINFRFSALRPESAEQQIFSIQFFESFVVFDVDRTACAVLSKPTENKGHSVNATAFYHSGSISASTTRKVYEKLAFIKDFPVLGRFLVLLGRVGVFGPRKIEETVQGLKLRKYFKF